MNWLRTRDKVAVAVVVTALSVVALLASLNLQRFPLIGTPMSNYHAEFSEAAGLTKGVEVRVAGISVGEVQHVRVAGDRVVVDFTVEKSIKLGGASTASVEVATVLGNLFLQVHSSGPGRLSAGATIPLERTAVPYSLVSVLEDLGKVAREVDVKQLEASFNELALTLGGTSAADVTAALTGITRISRTLADHKDELAALITDTQKTVDLLNSKSAQLIRVLADGGAFLRLVQQRRDLISNMLAHTTAMSVAVSKLIDKNGAKLHDLFQQLQTVGRVLANNKETLGRSMALLGQFSTNITNATGSGPWIDLMLPLFLPDNVIKACGADPQPGCGR